MRRPDLDDVGPARSAPAPRSGLFASRAPAPPTLPEPPAAGRALRDEGLEAVASDADREAWLRLARSKATSYCRAAPSLTITAETLRPFLPPCPHPNLWGAIFRGPDWEPAGFVQSRHADAHARMVRAWRLRQ